MGLFEELESLWEETEVIIGDLPEGEYDVVIDCADYKPSRTSRNGNEIAPSVSFQMTVVSSEHKGVSFWTERMIWSKKEIERLKKDMLLLDCNIPAKLSDVGDALQSAIGTTLRVKRSSYQTKAGITKYDTWFNEVIKRPEISPDIKTVVDVVDEEVPF